MRVPFIQSNSKSLCYRYVEYASICKGTVSQFSSCINERHPGASSACYAIALYYTMRCIGAVTADRGAGGCIPCDASQVDDTLEQGLIFWVRFMPGYVQGDIPSCSLRMAASAPYAYLTFGQFWERGWLQSRGAVS